MSNIAEWRNRRVLYGLTMIGSKNNQEVFTRPLPVGDLVREKKERERETQVKYLRQLFEVVSLPLLEKISTEN